MIADEEAASLLREANPIPSLDGYELDDIGPAEYPTLLEQTRIPEAQTLVDQSTDSAGVHIKRGKQHLAWVAAAVVVLMGGLVWLLGSSDDTSSVVTQPPVSAPSLPEATKPAPAPSAAAAVLPPPVLQASRVPHDESVFGTSLMGTVASSEAGLVAVGAARSWVIGSGNSLVWVSVDGRSWTRLSDDESVFGEALLGSVATHGDGFVAVGSTPGSSVEGHHVAAVWMSADGVDWEPVPHDESIFGGDSDEFMASVVEYNGGLVAVGSSTGSAEGSSSRSAVWASPDGLTWTRVSSDEPIFERSKMVDIVGFGEGLVAVGHSSCCDPGAANGFDADAVVWTSADGVEWKRVSHDAPSDFGGDGDQIMVSVASSGGRLVAVGRDMQLVRLQGSREFYDGRGLGDAAAWTSEDGLAWTRLPHDESVFGAGDDGWAAMSSVEALGEGFVAGGFQQVAGFGGDMDAVVWTTSDGLTWARVSDDDAVFGGDEAQMIFSIAVHRGDVIAVGAQQPVWDQYGVDDPDAAVWTLTP